MQLNSFGNPSGGAKFPQSVNSMQSRNSVADSHLSTSSSQKGAGLFREANQFDFHSAEDFLNMSFWEKQKFLDSLLVNDIKAGFLLAFCDSQFCSENARFVVAVNKYCDCFEGSRSWPSWEGLDKQKGHREITNLLSDEQCKDIERELYYIADNFLTPDGKFEICISPGMLKRTRMRMELFRIYGPEVFTEASMDPMNTLMKDILPRFVVSQIYQDMGYFVDKINNVAFVHITALELPLPVDPPDVAVDAAYMEELDNYFVHPILYAQLLKYLNRIVSSENLLCIRAVDMFTMLFNNTHGAGKMTVTMGNLFSSALAMNAITLADVAAEEKCAAASDNHKVRPDYLRALAVSQAWLIYLHFLVVNAPLEICTDHYTLQNVAQAMAAPSKNMFRTVRKICYAMVKEHFYTFKTQSEFLEIPALAAAAALAKSTKVKPPSGSCTIS
jgi:hypothetical protein